MNLVGSGFWKTFNLKSMKNSKSSSVKPTTSTDTSKTITVIKKESKKGSKDNLKPIEQSKSPLLNTIKSNYKHGSVRESTKGGGGGRGGVGVDKGIIHSGNNQIVGSKNIPPSTKSTQPFTMVTNLKRAASVPLMINTPRNNLNRVKQSDDSKMSTTTTTEPTIYSISNNSDSMFQYFDTNGNGYISEDELIEMMGSLGEPINRDEAKLMIKEADVNLDGKIDYLEFRNLLNRLPLIFSSPSSMSLREAFNIFDQDSDGYVNLEEVKLIATAIGIETNEKSIDLINNQLQSTASSSSSSPPTTTKKSTQNSNNQSENKKFNYDQLKRLFDSIEKM